MILKLPKCREYVDLVVNCLIVAHHEIDKLIELNHPIAVVINLIDQVLQLAIRWILAQWAQNSSKFFGGDVTI